MNKTLLDAIIGKNQSLFGTLDDFSKNNKIWKKSEFYWYIR